MAFSDAQRTDIRRFCGYSAYGSGASGFSSWRFFTEYGELEFRMSNLSPSEETVVIGMLANLIMLDAAIPAASAGLDVASAAVYVRNQNEVRDRTRLLDQQRRSLCGFFGIPPGADLQGGGTIRMVV